MTGQNNHLRVPMPAHESILSDGLHRKDDQPSTSWQGRWPLIAVIALGVLAVVVGIFATFGAGDVEDQLDTAVQEKIDLGREVVAACARGEVVQSPTGQDLCRRGIEVQSDPVPAAVQGLPGDRGPGPTLEQIEAAVAAYCAAHSGCAGRPPTTAEVAAAVADYLIAHPPQPGRPPTAAEIAEQVTIYFANNPPPQGEPGDRGPRGETGERGPPPSQAEIQAAVDAHLAANPPPMGPRGPAGPTCQDGTHLEQVQFESGQFGLACVFDDQPEPDPDPTTEPTAAPTTEPETDGGLVLGG